MADTNVVGCGWIDICLQSNIKSDHVIRPALIFQDLETSKKFPEIFEKMRLISVWPKSGERRCMENMCNLQFGCLSEIKIIKNFK